MNTDWLDRAACADKDPVLFDGQTCEDRLAASQVCAACPVLALCKADAARRGFGMRAQEQVRAGLWWNARGKPQPILPPVVPVEGGIQCDGHQGSRHRWMTGKCQGEGCQLANRLYETAYYARRVALRRSSQAA